MPPSTATLHRWTDVPKEQLTDSLSRRFVTGDRLTVAHLRLDAGARVPMHCHEHEQMSWVVEGALRFMVGGEVLGESVGSDEVTESRTDGAAEEVVVRAGEVLHLPPGVPHSAEALEDTVAVDIFSPPRRDWVDGSDAYLRGEDA